MKLQRSYHKEVQQIAAHCGIEGSVPLSPLRKRNYSDFQIVTFFMFRYSQIYPQIYPQKLISVFVVSQKAYK